MSRKRDKPYFSRHVPYSFPKRRRPLPLQPDTSDDLPFSDDNPSAGAIAKQPAMVLVVGIPSDCSLLDLKSRFEIYGSVSRTRMDPNGLAYITFRSHDSAQSAISAAVDPSFGITLLSKPVMWASDAVPQWREGVTKKEGVSSAALSSKLLRAEVPLSRRGRGLKLGSAIVNPRDVNNGNGDTNNKDIESRDGGGNSGLGGAFKGREIVAYNDIL